MNEQKYYGLFCPQHGLWMKDAHEHIFYYPDKMLMEAHWNQMQIEAEHFPAMRHHLWEVTEVGKELWVNPDALPPTSYLCAVPVNPYKDLDQCV